MRVLVVTGSSGGHIFPALSFLDTLKCKCKDIDVLLILPKTNITDYSEVFDYKEVSEKNLNLGQRPLITQIFERLHRFFRRWFNLCNPSFNLRNQKDRFFQSSYKVNHISISSIKLSLKFKNLIAVLRFFKAVLESTFILLSFRPDIVIGFGSLVCIPIVIFARMLGIKILIHEQNVIPGRANRFLAIFVDRIGVSFHKTKNYFFKGYRKKILFTGNPIRKELVNIDKIKALDFFGFSDNKFTVLVMGGSSGSHRINIGFLMTVSSIKDRLRLQVIHITGYKDFDLLKHSYKDLNVNVRVFSFLKPMQYAYSACDLILSRAGATTIAEIIHFRLPAIIVPYPYAYRHQASNAKVLKELGSAIIIMDDALETDILRYTIENLINNPDKIEVMRSSYNNFPKIDANTILVDNVLSLL